MGVEGDRLGVRLQILAVAACVGPTEVAVCALLTVSTE